MFSPLIFAAVSFTEKVALPPRRQFPPSLLRLSRLPSSSQLSPPFLFSAAFISGDISYIAIIDIRLHSVFSAAFLLSFSAFSFSASTRAIFDIYRAA